MADTDMMPPGDGTTGSPEPVGTRLRRAREAAGLGLPQVSDITKIPMRMLVLIESSDFAALPAKTYATGFTRTYARALGLDEREYVDAVRADLGLSSRVDPQPTATFEPGDPARVPTARLAWLAALGAIGVIVAGLFFWRTYYSPAVSLPSLLPAEQATAEPAPAAAPAPLPFVSEAPVPTEAATAEPIPAPAAFIRSPARRAPRRSEAAAPDSGMVLPQPAEPVRAPLPASTGAT